MLGAQSFQRNFGSIFFSIVDVLAIIPIASREISTLSRNGAGPGGTASCNIKDNTISYPLSKAQKLKVGVHLMRAGRGGFFSLWFSARLHSYCSHASHTPMVKDMRCVYVYDHGSGEKTGSPILQRERTGLKKTEGQEKQEKNEQVPRRSETILNTGADILAVLQCSRDGQSDILIEIDG